MPGPVTAAAAASLAKRLLESDGGKRALARLEREASDRLADGIIRLADKKKYVPKRGAPARAGAKKKAGGRRR